MHHIRVPAEDFITAWVKDPMSKAGKHSPKHQLMCDEEGTLFSYGRHFPLAKRVKKFTLLNMHKSTVTTTGHQQHVLNRVGPRAVMCIDTLDEAGALNFVEQELEKQLLAASKTRNKGLLFSIAYNPRILIGIQETLEDYLGTTNLPLTLWKKAEEGSLLKYFTAMLLKKPCVWPSRYELKICFLLDAVFQTGFPGKFSGLKFIQDYHRIGAAAVAAQISSIDGGAALRTVNDQ